MLKVLQEYKGEVVDSNPSSNILRNVLEVGSYQLYPFVSVYLNELETKVNIKKLKLA